MKSNSTPAAAAPDFPIPYPSQTPYDDLSDAMTFLNILDRYVDEGWQDGISKEEIPEISVLLSEAQQNLKTVLAYLNAEDPNRELYREVRRKEITGIFERGMS